MQLPEGFSHVGDGRLSIDEEHLLGLKAPRDIAEVYQVADTWIAKGMYGIVRSAVSKQTGISYAAKYLRRRRRGQCCLSEINHEIAVLMLCADSDHVVKLQAVHETRSEIALILELATGGELQTLIDEQGSLSEQKTRVCMREILRALQHMHKKSIAHLDLKPQNILLAGKSVDDGLKLCDFGIARFIAEKHKIYEIVGTPDYVAPEVLHYDPLSLQTDIWSIGVVAYVLLTGLSPFGGDSKQETFLNVTKCSLTFPDELFSGISSDAIDFIKSVLRIKPKDRLTVDECLEHRWLKEDVVCLREEILAARASAALNKPETNAVMNENGEKGSSSSSSSSSNAAVVANGNGYSSSVESPVRLHQANGSQKVLTVVVECGSTNAAADEERCETSSTGGEAGVGGGGGKGRKTSPPVVVVGGCEVKLVQTGTTGTGQRDLATIAEENKENVIVVGGGGLVSRSLFPDAPTTPKVSRKALPVEPLIDGHLYPHHHHHHHHHNSNNQYQPQSQHHLHHSFAAAHHVLNHNSGSSLPMSTGVSCSPSTCVKKHVQKMRLHSPVAVSPVESSSEEMVTVATAPAQPVRGADERNSELCPLPGWVDPDGVSEGSIGILATMTDTMNHVAVPDEAASASLPCADETTTVASFCRPASVTPTTINSSSGSSTLCTLKCIEPATVVGSGATDNVHGAATNGHSKALQPSDKDAITC